ncbi:DUF4962 domain-containing protein [Luteolibacter ambystomatis]|uniref:DUF4962 domain-containing protein n=1 Tax=Luteolibacter ambystomatis TaxID=2824561 RepID=A0A975J0V8_9BACT|nr:DUF4962 domain-containing protein [Luteolibacter ambystomatis]QUE51934.1 DUF4962 domain-containing protein [Luteolibacter ambystomatis]
MKTLSAILHPALLLLSLPLSGASAATIQWIGGGSTNLISNATNWGGTIPRIADGNSGEIGNATIRGDLPTAMQIVLDGTTWAKEGTTGAARDTDIVAGSDLTFNGGSFSTERHTWWRGVIRVNGLSLTVPGDWRMREGCKVYWNSGEALVGGFTDESTGALDFKLTGGRINSATYSIGTNSRIDFTGAKTGVLVARDPGYRATFESMITTGKIVVDGAPAQTNNFEILSTGSETRLTFVQPPPVALHLENQSFSLPESAAAGTLVGTITATSPQAGASFSYSIISGNFDNDFSLEPLTGRLKVAGTLSYSGIPTYRLLVQATDQTGNATTGTITINVQLPLAITTQWATGPSNGSIVTATNWNSGLPTRSPRKPGLINNGDIAKVVGRDDLYSKDLVLSGNAKLTGADRFGGPGGASVTLNDSSSWKASTLDFGRNATAPTSIQVNGPNAELTIDGEILISAASYHWTSIFQRSGKVSIRNFGGDNGVLHLMGGNCQARTTSVYVNFWPGSSGLLNMPAVDGLTVDPNGNTWDDDLYPFGANSYDYSKYYLMSMWGSGAISVAGQWGAPFEQVFQYSQGAGITLQQDQPFTTDGTRPIHLSGWVLRFNSLSGGVPYMKWLVDSGRVTWTLGERGSPVGSGSVLYSWVNSNGVKLFLSDNSLWAESAGSQDSPLYYPYLASYGIIGATNTAQGADLDTDLMDNLAEFAFGGNPTIDDRILRAPKLTTLQGPNGPKQMFRFFRRHDAENAGLKYRVQMSTNLNTWSDIEPTMVTNIDSIFETVGITVDLPQAFFRIILELNPGGKEAVPAERSIAVPRIYEFNNGEAMPQGDVDLRSPWLHIQSGATGPFSFRLSQDPSFQTGVLQSQPQAWQFWNPWQNLSAGTWHWQWGTGPAGSVQWNPGIHTFTIIATARTVNMPPNADQMANLLRTRQMPVLNCNPDQIGRLKNTMSSSELDEFSREVWRNTYEKLPPLAVTLSPASYTSRSAFESAVRSNLANKFYFVKRLIRGYAVFGNDLSANNTIYHPKTKALEILNAIKQEYDTRQWTYDWGSGPQTVTVATAAADFGGNIEVVANLCDALEMFESDLTPAAVTLFAGIAKRDYCKNPVVDAADFLTGGMPIATKLFNQFEHVYWDQHWDQIYIYYPCVYLPILMRYHPDLVESFKWSYNVYLYRGTMGGRNDGSWMDGNAYLGASEWTLVDILALYTKLTNYSFNFFDFSDWHRNFPGYIYFSNPPGSNHGGTFSDGVGFDPSGTSADTLVQIIHAHNPNTPVAKWDLLRRFGVGGRDLGRIDWVFERSTGSYQAMALLSAFEHYGRYVPTGTETPPGELARSFPDTGLVTMHTDHRTTANNFYANFRSTPYGAQYHAHPAQNAFNVGFGGKDLFWHTGYYNTGPYPFHDRLDYKSTWGHNAILPNKVTQLFDSTCGYGWLPRFVHGDKITYSLGDATMAYPTRDRPYIFAAGAPMLNELGYGYPEVERVRRHIMMLRPSHLVIYDELEARQPIPWMYLLQSRTNQNMTKRGDGWITAYNTIGSGTYGIGNFQLFCNTPVNTTVTNHFRFAHPSEFNDKYPNGYQRHHHAYIETTGKYEKMRFLSVIAVSKSGSATTVPAQITGATGSDGLFTVTLGSYTVKAQLDGNKAPYLEARDAAQTAVLVTGSNVQNITLNGVTRSASLRGSTLLMERGTYRGDIFVEDSDKLPDVFRLGNKYD